MMSSVAVKQQYELYPYPDRSLNEDKARLQQVCPLEHLDTIASTLFEGRLPDIGFRLLVAGGGTGDACVMLGHQAKERGLAAEIVYIDLSEAAQNVAIRRCQALGIDNVVFHTGSLLDMPPERFGQFDYINCSGVLHHLQEPSQGIQSLANLLKPHGGMGIMLYGALGRTGIYEIQSTLKTLLQDRPLSQQIAMARVFLANLSPSHWLNKNEALRYFAEMSDAELVDRFLHPQDQAFTVDQIYELAASVSLHLVDFAPGLLYDPALFFGQPDWLRYECENLSDQQRHQMAENLYGMHAKHSFFISRHPHPRATVNEQSLLKLHGTTGTKLASAIEASGVLGFKMDGATFRFPGLLNPTDLSLLSAIDNQRSVVHIHQQACATHPELHKMAPAQACQKLVEVFTQAGIMTVHNPPENDA